MGFALEDMEFSPNAEIEFLCVDPIYKKERRREGIYQKREERRCGPFKTQLHL